MRYYTAMRYIGIDYGTKKVGVALSDEAASMGFPYGVLPTSSTLADQIFVLAREKEAAGVVIGESRDFSGSENPVAAEARSLARALEAAGLTVYFEPETYTTQEARRYPDGTRMPGSPDVDSSAAALILTSFLERKGYNQES